MMLAVRWTGRFGAEKGDKSVDNNWREGKIVVDAGHGVHHTMLNEKCRII